MTDDEHRAARLAENIQRDDLSTYETAKAIKQLYDSGKTPTEIGALVHKSKAWVSKHLAAAHPNLSWQARNLLEDGSTEDLELVLAVDQLAKLDYYEANQLVPKIRNGNAGRETVREQLTVAREKDAARKAQQEAIAAERNDPEYRAKAKAEREANEARRLAQQEEQRKRMHLDPNRLMVRFWDWCAENEGAGSEFCHPARLCRDQCDSLTHAVDHWYAAGQGMNVSQLATRLLTEYVNAEVDPGYGDENRSLASWQVSAMSYAVSMNGKSAGLEEFLDWYAAKVVRPAQRRYS